MRAAPQQALEADTSQLGVPASGSLLAFNLIGFGEASQRWLVHLKPDPLDGRRMEFSPQAFREAFAEAPRPPRDQIALHECDECERVRTDLAPYAVDEVPDQVVEYHADSIPLPSPAAFRYYLPRYVQLTCENRDTNATDFLLFNLCPDDPTSEFWSGRCDAFTRRECEAVVSYLWHRQSWLDADVDSEWIEPALEFWRDLASARL